MRQIWRRGSAGRKMLVLCVDSSPRAGTRGASPQPSPASLKIYQAKAREQPMGFPSQRSCFLLCYARGVPACRSRFGAKICILPFAFICCIAKPRSGLPACERATFPKLSLFCFPDTDLSIKVRVQPCRITTPIIPSQMGQRELDSQAAGRR